MPHLQGKKISGSHSTVIQAAVSIVETARSLDDVTKVILGIIKPVRSTAVPKSLKITDVDAGLRLKVRGPNSVQELFVYTSNPRATEEAIRTVFEN